MLGGGRALAQTAARGTAGPVAATRPSPAAAVATSVPAVATPTAPTSADAPAGAGGPLVVRSRVVGEANGLGLPGVTVLLQGTDLGVSTSAEGTFELTLPESAAGGTLLVLFIGYRTQRLPLAAGNPAPLAIQLQEDVQGLMSGVVVVGGYGRKPWPWHPRRLYQWSRYQLLRPFRQ